ncbi:hypothetical protein [Dactylosporangium sp. CA-092794]|uniref:hypothetical protein n=1 Tax=Dactylosporangium sp. CA-092794 TaxID=3239929 RepID=UPI003D8E0D80
MRRALPALLVRRTRRRRIGLAGGTVLAAVAVLATVLLAPDRGGTITRIPADAPSSPSPSAVPSVAPDVTRSHVPGWLPAGFRERQRAVVSTSAGIKAVRTWAKAPLGAGGSRLDSVPYIRLVTLPTRTWEDGTRVDVGGAAGWYVGPTKGNPGASLGWLEGPDRTVVIETNSVTSQADLLRVAVSTRPDPTPLPQPLLIGWTPFQPREYTYSYGGDSPTEWDATVAADDPSDVAASLTVMLAPSTDVPEGGTAVQVGGLTGRLVVEESPAHRNPRQCVVLPQPNSPRLLTVCSAIAGPGGARMPEDQLLRAAGSVDTTIRAKTDWLG